MKIEEEGKECCEFWNKSHPPALNTDRSLSLALHSLVVLASTSAAVASRRTLECGGLLAGQEGRLNGGGPGRQTSSAILVALLWMDGMTGTNNENANFCFLF